MQTQVETTQILRFGDGIFKIKMMEKYKNEFMVPKKFNELHIEANSEQSVAIHHVTITISSCP